MGDRLSAALNEMISKYETASAILICTGEEPYLSFQNMLEAKNDTLISIENSKAKSRYFPT